MTDLSKVPLEPPTVFPAPGIEAPPAADNRVLEPDDIQREPFAGINRAIAGLIAEEKRVVGGQLSFVYPSKVWEYPWALARHPSPEGELVLDAGCGVSTLPIHLSKLGATVVAIDFDGRWLSGEARAARFHDAPVVTVEMDMSALKFPDALFHRVYCISVFEHIDPAQQAQTISELARVLRPGGVLYLTVDYDEIERRNADDVVFDRLALQRCALAPSGLEIEGTTRYEVEDWGRQHQRMREFKLHTFASMAMTLRKPPEYGPASAEAIAHRRARAAEIDLRDAAPVGPDDALEGVDAPAIQLLVDAPHTLDAHAGIEARVRAAHDAAPERPVFAVASHAAVRGGCFDGTGLDVYGVRFAPDEEPPAAERVSMIRACAWVEGPAGRAEALGYLRA